MKRTSSVKSLKNRKGCIMARRKRRICIINKLNPKFKAKQ